MSVNRNTYGEAGLRHHASIQTEALPMSHLFTKLSLRRPEPEAFLDKPPFPLAGAALGMIAVVNVASAVATLLSV